MDESELLQLDSLELTHFWYKARKFQLSKWFGSLSSTPLKVLDLGSATGGNTLLILSLGHLVSSLEFSEVGVRIQKSKGIAVNQGDARDIPYAESSFDVVICLDVLEHIQEDKLVMLEIYRVLRRNGVFLISVPEDPKLWSRHDEAVNHVRRYERNQLLDLVSSAGLVTTQVWSTLFILRPFIVFARKYSKGSNLKRINTVVNAFLYFVCRFEFLLPRYQNKGVTLWLEGKKLN